MTTLEHPTPEAARAQTPAASRPIRPFVLAAVFRRNFLAYFTSPAGYVFTFLFVVACSAAAFWRPVFFTNNLANLASLNELMPYLLLVFIPAITMSVWAEERRQGTEEILFTLPARDIEIVLGKYLAALGIYTVSLLFLAVGCVGVLTVLGRPDAGVMLATFLGYWLMGAALLATGMVASLLTANVTVAFILGVAACAIPVLLGGIGSAAGPLRRPIEGLSMPAQFAPFGVGKVSLGGVFYFAALAAAMLYVNMVLLGRRHWAGGERSRHQWGHMLGRIASVLVGVASLAALARAAGVELDVTSERLHTLSRESKELARSIPKNRPVFIQAYLSPDVPREYVQVKQDLVNTLKSFASQAGSKIRLSLVETDRYSEAAREAEKRFGITPRRVLSLDGNRQESEEVFLGVAFTSGAEEVVIPFFDRGLPVEYELTRSLRTVSRTGRKKVGILQTDARLLGGFDFRSFNPQEEWSIVTELKKQYDVSSVSADSEVPSDLDVLLVAQPSSLPQRGIDTLTAYVRGGGATILFLDPMFLGDPSIAPSEPRQNPGGMFGGGPPPEPKGNLGPLLDLIGLDWPTTQVVWNLYNPHKQQLPDLPPEVVFIGRDSGADAPFNARQEATKGLQELVMLFPGLLRPRSNGGPKFAGLLKTDDRGGIVPYEQLIQRGMMGATINPNRPYFPTGDPYTLAARLEGPAPDAPAAKADPEAKDKPKGKDLHVIAIADLDLISETFFNLRRKQVGALDLDFDNVTFVLNCVDVLAGDEELVNLRKKRPQHRTLSALEGQTKRYEKERIAEEEKADKQAKRELDEAQARLDKRVEEIRSNKEMDARTKDVMLANVESVENRRLDVAKAEIEDKKRQKIRSAKDEAERNILQLQDRVKYLAVSIAPLPVLLLGLGVLAIRSGRENLGANPNRVIGR